MTSEIWSRFPATIELSLAGLLLGLLWTIPLGVISALRPRGIVDRISQAIVEFGVAMPSFLLGVLLILFLYAGLKIAPSPVGELDIGAISPPRHTGLTVIDCIIAGQWGTCWSALRHLLLPAVTLAITACPPILQLTRNAMIDALRGEHIRTARSLGLPQRTIRWYALKNALLPVVTMTAMTFGYLLGGTVLVEQVFSWPGIGLYAVQSLQQLDYAPVLGVVLLASAVYVLVYLLADVLAVLIDPRLREDAYGPPARTEPRARHAMRRFPPPAAPAAFTLLPWIVFGPVRAGGAARARGSRRTTRCTPMSRRSSSRPRGTTSSAPTTNGFDVFSRVLYATRIDFSVSLLGVALAVLIGVPMGAASGSVEGLVGETFSRLAEMVQSIPLFLFALMVFAALGNSKAVLVGVIGFVTAPCS